MRRSIVSFFVFAGLAVVASASAKGPDYALVSGPGIGGAIRFDGEEGGTGTPLGALATYAGFASQAFGHAPSDPTTAKPPEGTLGARYRIVYSVPTPGGRRSIEADLYPFATPRPVTYMKPGQPLFPGMATQGGWYLAPTALRRTLAEAGLVDAPRAGGSHVIRWAVTGALALAALLLAGAAVSRRRTGPAHAPAP